MNDVLDVYLKTHLETKYAALRITIVLATTGSLKRDTQLSWNGYVEDNSSKANFEFWSGDKVALLMEKYMLDEHIFTSEDRVLLRKSLALAADGDYDQSHLHRLFLKQLSLNKDGLKDGNEQKPRELIKALRIVNLFAQIYAHWSEDEGNLKQALFATERALLWSWHRINLEPPANVKKYHTEITPLFLSYQNITQRYFLKLESHMYVRDGFAGWGRESAELSLIVFEQIGIIALIGLSRIYTAKESDDALQHSIENVEVVASGLISLIENNPVSSSPAFDEHSIDITLALMLLIATGKTDYAKKWLRELFTKVDYAYKSRQNFPISTDSEDDLVEFIVFGGSKITDKLINMSWLLPTLAGWTALLECEEGYAVIAKNSKGDYPEVCQQLWHPSKDNLQDFLYFTQAQYRIGEAEAPISLPETSEEYLLQMKKLLDTPRYDVLEESPATKAGVYALDLIACRHFRTPVPPFVWYQVGGLKKNSQS